MYVMGIDGGGTKTQLSLCDAHGHVLGTHKMQSLPLSCGEEDVLGALKQGVAMLYDACGLSTTTEASAVCFGVPGYGESPAMDAMMQRVAYRCFGNVPMQLVNDAQVAWAGSFAMQPGINVVAGTGTIAFGVDAAGNTARCGGWGFGMLDEGSGHWLGRQMISLFCKQADGRIPERGPLYEMVHAHFGTDNDFEIVEKVEAEYLPKRDKIASLQRILLKAAQEGDTSCVRAYEDAAYEIALNVFGIRSRLVFDDAICVSYSGGIFSVGDLIMQPFAELLTQEGIRLVTPIAPPWVGALMIGLSLLGGDFSDAMQQLSALHGRSGVSSGLSTTLQ